MAIVLSDNIQTNAPKPNDSRYYNNLVPYSSVSAANAAIVSGVRFTGLTVNISGVEYWYKNGITNPDLVIKTMGGTSTLTGATNGIHLINSGTSVSLGGLLTQPTIFTGTTVNHLKYNGDYSLGFTARSIPDVGYVTGYSQSALVNVCNVITPTYTATTTNNFIGASGGTTIWLPNSPKCGEKISVADTYGNALSCAICVCSHIHRIASVSDCYSRINTDFGSVTFVFNGTFWSAVAFIN